MLLCRIPNLNFNSKYINREIQKTRLSQGASPYYSPEKPDIPLREPLEEESKNKRKVAREMLETELRKLVHQNKQNNEEQRRKEAEKLQVGPPPQRLERNRKGHPAEGEEQEAET